MIERIRENKKITLSILSILIVIVLGIGGYIAWTTFNSKDDKSTSQDSISETDSNDQKTKKVKKSVTGKTANEDRQDALKAAGEILTLAAKSEKGMTPEERAEKIDKGDMSVVDKGLAEKIRLADVYSEEDMKVNVYQALIAMTKYIAVDGKVEPVSNNAWQSVYVDSEIGVAYVPLTTFYDNGTVFSFEMVYVDGEWKFSPYSFMDIVKLSATLQSEEK